MSIRCDTYSLLIDRLGEEEAFKLCEELGGARIQVPQKAHRVYRIRVLAGSALETFDKEATARRKFVEKMMMEFLINERTIYKIIQEVEDERRRGY